MSSEPTFAAPGTTNGVPHTLSAVVLRLTQIWPFCFQVAHSWPVESLAIVMASARTELMVAGYPLSRL